ncbi:uncharacterized protein [Mytilus edulis]|uniref:uncharacterized protein n=1 Tax=Mytilus edulis TaxID=6550 RepID=UPI0039EE2142
MAGPSTTAHMRKAQVPISCNFCNENVITWKCEECDILMCDSCKNRIHERMKSTKDHEVISFLNKEEEPSASIEVLSEVISYIFHSYTTNVPVGNLLCSDDDIVYIVGSKKSLKLIKGKMLKMSVRTIMSIDIPTFDIAVNKNGNVLFTHPSFVPESPISIILPSGEVETVLDPKPMRLLALHINKQYELICGLREQGEVFPLHDFSVRQVVLFGIDHKKKMTLETDTKGEKLFTHPARIRTDSNNNIYVIDWTDSNHTGKIVATDRNFRLKFMYCGPNNFEFFNPMSIAVTPSDNIVVSDKHNHALLVLNSKGTLIALQCVLDINIACPNALCIDSEGLLLIGCFEKEDTGKIHAVKITEILM